MKLPKSLRRFILSALSLLAVTPVLWAQEKPAAPPAGNSSGLLQTALVLVAVVLAFVIWGVGQVVITLARQVVEKQKQQKVLPLILLALFLTPALAHAQDPAAAQVPAWYGGLSSATFWSYVIVILTELVVIFSLLFFIRRLQSELLPAKVKKQSSLRKWWAGMDKKIFTRAVPVEKEADVLLDHDYDGIRELDNSLPPWWKYGFYITIGVAVIYLFNFHVLGYGKNPTEEYLAEMENARIRKEAYEAKNKDKIDENNVPMADAAGINAGKEIFTTTCFPCHGKLGEGGAGPNLTDAYWLHKGSLNDIYMSVKNGYPDKGMQAWDKNFTPKEISFLASYIHTLKGTNPPNGKAPQGELFEEEKQPADSAKVSTGPVKS